MNQYVVPSWSLSPSPSSLFCRFLPYNNIASTTAATAAAAHKSENKSNKICTYNHENAAKNLTTGDITFR